MLFNNAYDVFREEVDGSSADYMFDAKDTEEVVDELEDTLESIPEMEGEEEVTNGGVPFTAEMCNLVAHESTNIYGRPKKQYYLELAILTHFMESEGVDDVEDAVEQVADANSGMEDDNGQTVEIDKADIVVVAPSDEEVKEIVSDAVQEAKLCGGRKKGPARKKLDQLTGSLAELKNKGIKVAKKMSGGSKKKAKKKFRR